LPWLAPLVRHFVTALAPPREAIARGIQDANAGRPLVGALVEQADDLRLVDDRKASSMTKNSGANRSTAAKNAVSSAHQLPSLRDVAQRVVPVEVVTRASVGNGEFWVLCSGLAVRG
jgi:hypothetical protein